MKWVSAVSKKRLKVVLYGFVIFLVAVVIRLFYVQIIKYDELTELAKENWDREIPFSSERGEIVDRNGEVIVTNKLSPTLYFMPAQNDNIEQAAKQIASVLN